MTWAQATEKERAQAMVLIEGCFGMPFTDLMYWISRGQKCAGSGHGQLDGWVIRGSEVQKRRPVMITLAQDWTPDAKTIELREVP